MIFHVLFTFLVTLPIKNMKILKYSEKIRVTLGNLEDPLSLNTLF